MATPESRRYIKVIKEEVKAFRKGADIASPYFESSPLQGTDDDPSIILCIALRHIFQGGLRAKEPKLVFSVSCSSFYAPLSLRACYMTTFPTMHSGQKYWWAETTCVNIDFCTCLLN